MSSQLLNPPQFAEPGLAPWEDIKALTSLVDELCTLLTLSAVYAQVQSSALSCAAIRILSQAAVVVPEDTLRTFPPETLQTAFLTQNVGTSVEGLLQGEGQEHLSANALPKVLSIARAILAMEQAPPDWNRPYKAGISAGDVRSIRPDLTYAECLKVLDLCSRSAEHGQRLDWEQVEEQSYRAIGPKLVELRLWWGAPGLDWAAHKGAVIAPLAARGTPEAERRVLLQLSDGCVFEGGGGPLLDKEATEQLKEANRSILLRLTSTGDLETAQVVILDSEGKAWELNVNELLFGTLADEEHLSELSDWVAAKQVQTIYRKQM